MGTGRGERKMINHHNNIPNTINPHPCLLPVRTSTGGLSTMDRNPGSSAGLLAYPRRNCRGWPRKHIGRFGRDDEVADRVLMPRMEQQ